MNPPDLTLFDMVMYAALRAVPTATDVEHGPLRRSIELHGLDPDLVLRLRSDLAIAQRARQRLQRALDEGGDGDAVRVCNDIIGDDS
jgi:hypothetical protein